MKASQVFAETTHVVTAPHGFACVVNGHTPDVVICYKFHRNPFRGFWATAHGGIKIWQFLLLGLLAFAIVCPVWVWGC